MKPTENRPPDDREIETLLGRRYHDTTPEFEARWVALKRELRNAPPRRRPAPWLAWLGALTVGAAAVALFVSLPRHVTTPAAPAEASTALAELFAMDSVLSRGTALLDGENRDALLHLPIKSAQPN